MPIQNIKIKFKYGKTNFKKNGKSKYKNINIDFKKIKCSFNKKPVSE